MPNGHISHNPEPAPDTTLAARGQAGDGQTPLTDPTSELNNPGQDGLHTLFQRRVSAHPDAPAVRHDGDVLTYRELDHAANALAHRLRDANVTPGDVVGLLAHRSLQSVIAMVAVLKAGASYLPLDPEYPNDRLTFLLNDAEASAVLVHDDYRGRAGELTSYSGSVLAFDDPMDTGARTDTAPPNGGTTAADRAYVIYTSGSTGRPKGVECTHRGLIRISFDKADWGFPTGGVSLHVTSLSFDPSQHEVWATLLNGGCLVILPDATPSLDRIADLIRRYDVTFAALSTGLFHLMVDHRLDDLKTLRWLQVGGDVMSPAHAAKARAAAPDTRIINAYGPTENGVITCRFDLTAEGWTDGPVPIGRGIDGSTVHILDDDMKPVPQGSIGQLCSGGDGVAIGYLGQPDLTAEKFVPDPFCDTPGARLYLTGDLVRMQPGGLIEFHGRVDRQVKINGKRVELDEIENGLREDTDLADAIITIRDAGSEAKRIAAYLKPQGETPESERHAFGQLIIARFKERFPAHMIPADVVVMDAFPLTAAGKVDRAKLPAPAAPVRRPAPTAHGAMPSSPAKSTLEAMVSEIWSRVLKIEDIGRDDNFFDLGGTSILLVKVHAQIQERLDSSVELATLFDKPKVRDLAAFLSTDGDAGAERDVAKAQASRADRRAEALARARRAKAGRRR